MEAKKISVPMFEVKLTQEEVVTIWNVLGEVASDEAYKLYIQFEEFVPESDR